MAVSVPAMKSLGFAGLRRGMSLRGFLSRLRLLGLFGRRLLGLAELNRSRLGLLPFPCFGQVDDLLEFIIFLVGNGAIAFALFKLLGTFFDPWHLLRRRRGAQSVNQPAIGGRNLRRSAAACDQ